MLSPPDRPTTAGLAGALERGWGLHVRTMEYRAVGFGGHHWRAFDADGSAWFLSLTDLHGGEAPAADTWRALVAAFDSAARLRDAGCDFVVAPVRTTAGDVTLEVEEFAMSVAPHVAGHSFEWGSFVGPEHRAAVVARIVELHAVPVGTVPRAIHDDFGLPGRADLTRALGCVGGDGDGPYGARTVDLLRAHSPALRARLAEYDALAARVRTANPRAVVTHGEPHAGNTMLSETGLVLIDWDTLLVAPPERDLWSLDPGDGSVLRSYTDMTGTSLDAGRLALYRLRWDLTDLAVYVRQFARSHAGGPDDVKAWKEIESLVTRLSRATSD